jgi:hypothetical protein
MLEALDSIPSTGGRNKKKEKYPFNKVSLSRYQWLTTVIRATWEAEISRILI